MFSTSILAWPSRLGIQGLSHSHTRPSYPRAEKTALMDPIEPRHIESLDSPAIMAEQKSPVANLQMACSETGALEPKLSRV